MTSIAETLGFSLPGASSIPAPDSNHRRMAAYSGQRIVEMVWEDLKPRDILTDASFDNAIKVLMALGGSTNALIHVIAIAGRAGIRIPLERFEEIGRRTPYLVNMRPAGKYLMEDFYYAGGLSALLEGMRELLDVNALTCTGRTLGENVRGARIHLPDVIRTPADPIQPEGGLVVLRGNLAPDGAVIKANAADPRLLRHAGRAVVFDDYNDMAARIDAPDLDVDADSVLILRNAGPLGGPGMPEWGMLPIPRKLLKQGVRDMVRISDARMSGTSYGTCILHVAPESFVGGPLALVRTGDIVALDVPGRRLDIQVDAQELARRRAEWRAPAPKYPRGYGAIFSQHVTQANEGCDFRFLEGTAPIPEPEIH
jgi:dihydroxy-acid dehydratase